VTIVNACTWPPLDEPYRSALVEAVELVFARFEPAGIVVAGSILRGTPDRASDLDIYVVNSRPQRQRIQQRLNGVPAEIFVNPPGQIERYIEDERARGRPSTAHMLATGFVVHDPEGVVAGLRATAAAHLEAGPQYTEPALRFERYAIADCFENALDMAGSDAETCALLLHHAVELAIRHRFRQARQWLPFDKQQLRALDELDPSLGRYARAFYAASDVHARIELAREIISRVAGATGFFEWESELEDV
jgi:hypothetical protein